MNREISFGFCLAILKKAWLVMLALVIVIAAGVGVFTEFFIQKKYSSSVTFYVVNSSGSDYTTSSVVSALQTLTDNYKELLKTDAIVDPISEALAEEYDMNYTGDQLKRMVSTATVDDTAMIVLKVTHYDREVAYNIAKVFSNEAPRLVTSIEKAELSSAANNNESEKTVTESIRAVDLPRLDTNHDSPSVLRNVVIAVAATAVFVYLIYFFVALLDNTIKTEEEIKEHFGEYPLMAVIPSWNKN